MVVVGGSVVVVVVGVSTTTVSIVVVAVAGIIEAAWRPPVPGQQLNGTLMMPLILARMISGAACRSASGIGVVSTDGAIRASLNSIGLPPVGVHVVLFIGMLKLSVPTSGVPVRVGSGTNKPSFSAGGLVTDVYTTMVATGVGGHIERDRRDRGGVRHLLGALDGVGTGDPEPVGIRGRRDLVDDRVVALGAGVVGHADVGEGVTRSHEAGGDAGADQLRVDRNRDRHARRVTAFGATTGLGHAVPEMGIGNIAKVPVTPRHALFSVIVAAPDGVSGVARTRPRAEGT